MNVSSQFEIRLSGASGQGLIMVGKILAEAAAIYDGKNASQSQSYGAEARSGASRSEVIISDSDIDNPRATKIDLLLTMTQEALDAYIQDVKSGGIILADSSFIREVPGGDYQIIALPITKFAEEKIGKPIVFNICMLGAVNHLAGLVKPESILRVIEARFPAEFHEINREALHLGIELAEKVA